jgi:hypothetical protein
MPSALNPIKRVWTPKALSMLPAQARSNFYGIVLPEPEVSEKNTDSIWSTFEALRGAGTGAEQSAENKW